MIVNSLQCHSKNVENEGLHLELANQKRAAAAKEAKLKQILAATELELQEVRREAEEYQKGSLFHNLENVALGNQAGLQYYPKFFNKSKDYGFLIKTRQLI